MIKFRVKDEKEDCYGMLIEFGSIEGTLAFVEDHGPIVISGTIEKPFIELLLGREEANDGGGCMKEADIMAKTIDPEAPSATRAVTILLSLFGWNNLQEWISVDIDEFDEAVSMVAEELRIVAEHGFTTAPAAPDCHGDSPEEIVRKLPGILRGITMHIKEANV